MQPLPLLASCWPPPAGTKQSNCGTPTAARARERSTTLAVDFADQDGSNIATVCRDGDMYVWDTVTGQHVRELCVRGVGDNNFVFSQQYDRIAGSSYADIVLRDTTITSIAYVLIAVIFCVLAGSLFWNGVKCRCHQQSTYIKHACIPSKILLNYNAHILWFNTGSLWQSSCRVVRPLFLLSWMHSIPLHLNLLGEQWLPPVVQKHVVLDGLSWH